MKYEILAERIAAAGLGTVGQDLFIHHMPGTVDSGILIRGPLQGIPVDNELPGYYRTDIQVIVRAQSTAAGNALAKQLTDTLVTKQRQVFEGMVINHFLLKALPIIYPRSDSNATEWSLHFDANYVILS